MTLDEKAMLVCGTGMDIPPSLLAALPEGDNPFGALAGETNEHDPEYDAMVKRIKKLVPGAAGRTAEIPGLGIKTMVLADGPAGLRINPEREGETSKFYCTAFPIATLLASTWDTEVLKSVGSAMGNEVLEYGVDIILGPGMNLHRNPLCGRNFEYYSEDPYVTGKMAAAMVNGIQSKGVGTSIKHYVANNQETNRNSVDSIVSERALRELYLEGFRIAVQEAHPWTVMSSYNKLNGTYTSESHDLLTKVLRNDWGFKGYVMTDWGGGSDVVAQMEAGNDLIMPGNRTQSKEIVKGVKEGRLDEKILDRNLERILNILVKTPRSKGFKHSDKPDLENNARVARRAAADGMILLKNNNRALPFSNDIKNVAVFGKSSYKIITGGTGSGDVNEGYSISLIDGLKNAGFSIDASTMDLYLNYMKEAEANQQKPVASFFGAPTIPEMKMDIDTIKNLADTMDIALVTIGRNSGEGGDRKAEPGDFYLTDDEKDLIKNVSLEFSAKNKRVAVILNIGGVIETAGWRDYPDAILLAWQPGQETGNSIVDVLSGKINPSGRLASTFPIKYDDVPSARNFPGIELPMTDEQKKANEALPPFMKKVPAQVVYEDDIYMGYRYYDTFNVPVAYEFGYGLSYTSFEFSNIKLDTVDFIDGVTVSLNIENIGERPGREVVQVYISAPAAKIRKPSKELKAFGKTKLLDPGESQIMSFTLSPRSLASFD
ncbi:MAG: glycoside hydrolase family 3 C-terminal domain-containing protein, partial [Deltaproteobacteria bacterium]|nr:glycoside hydrolase family 3 C-terminal domain-containing protein [Deltaproteobacteria bacterium]